MATTSIGVALMQALLVGCIGVLFYYMLDALGSKPLAGLMKVAVVMVIVVVFVPALWNTILNIKANIDEAVLWVEKQIDKLAFWRREPPEVETLQKNIQQQLDQLKEKRGGR